MNKKKGELLIVAVIVIALVLVLLLGSVSIQYFQINNTLTDIRSNLFYICQNAIVAFSDELDFEVYNIDTQKLKSVVSEILTNNYINNRTDITAINIEELYLITNESECLRHTDGSYSIPFIHIVISVEFNPVIKINNISKRKISIHQDVKLALMVY